MSASTKLLVKFVQPNVLVLLGKCYSNLCVDMILSSLLYRLGEACSHVAALLFYLEDFSRRRETSNLLAEESCTSHLCQWNVPKVEPKPEKPRFRDLAILVVTTDKPIDLPLHMHARAWGN